MRPLPSAGIALNAAHTSEESLASVQAHRKEGLVVEIFPCSLDDRIAHLPYEDRETARHVVVAPVAPHRKAVLCASWVRSAVRARGRRREASSEKRVEIVVQRAEKAHDVSCLIGGSGDVGLEAR